eukprot:scaffold90956_cov69-Phaeocystis_antarctica.AAC.3
MKARLSSNMHRGALRTTALLCSRSVSCHGSLDTAPAALPYTVHSVARTLNENRASALGCAVLVGRQARQQRPHAGIRGKPRQSEALESRRGVRDRPQSRSRRAQGGAIRAASLL